MAALLASAAPAQAHSKFPNERPSNDRIVLELRDVAVAYWQQRHVTVPPDTPMHVADSLDDPDIATTDDAAVFVRAKADLETGAIILDGDEVGWVVAGLKNPRWERWRKREAVRELCTDIVHEAGHQGGLARPVWQGHYDPVIGWVGVWVDTHPSTGVMAAVNATAPWTCKAYARRLVPAAKPTGSRGRPGCRGRGASARRTDCGLTRARTSPAR